MRPPLFRGGPPLCSFSFLFSNKLINTGKHRRKYAACSLRAVFLHRGKTMHSIYMPHGHTLLLRCFLRRSGRATRINKTLLKISVNTRRLFFFAINELFLFFCSLLLLFLLFLTGVFILYENRRWAWFCARAGYDTCIHSRCFNICSSRALSVRSRARVGVNYNFRNFSRGTKKYISPLQIKKRSPETTRMRAPQGSGGTLRLVY